MKHFDINGIRIELEKKRIKHMYIRILPPEGRVHISAPIRMSEEQIKSFVLSKFDWIQEQQSRIQQRKVHQELEYVTGEVLTVWGTSCTLLLIEDSSRNKVVLNGENLILTMKKDCTVIQRKKVMNNWYRKLLLQEIPTYLSKWEMIMGVKSSGFSIRDMKTRWGTCNIRTKNICFNLQLAKKPPKCLEYVIVHELVHLLEKSHNYIFKAYMDKYLPQWRVIKKELNGYIPD